MPVLRYERLGAEPGAWYRRPWTFLLAPEIDAGRGITAYLVNGGTLDAAQRMAGHSDPRTIKLYDRRGDQVPLHDVERISF